MEKTKAAENLSQWFRLDEQKPWEPGVYEVLLGNEQSIEYDQQLSDWYAIWDGNKFLYASSTVNGAFLNAGAKDDLCFTITRWRGLASYPSAKPKARGNRKVTRYVVMTSFTSAGYGLPIAVFEDKALADAYVQKEKFMHFYPLEVKNIRFRTPEAD